MSRIRRYLVPVLLLLPVIYICGKLLLTPVKAIRGVSAEIYTSLASSGLSPLQQHLLGWPWPFKRTVDVVSHTSGTPLIGVITVDFHAWSLFFDLALLTTASILAFIVLVWIIHYWNRPRFSLRMLFIVVGVIAVPIGWWASERQLSKREQSLKTMFSPQEIELGEPTYSGPEWLQRLCPEELATAFCHTTNITVSFGARADFESGLEDAVRTLPYVRRIDLNNYQPLRLFDPTAFSRIAEIHFGPRCANLETCKGLPHLSRLACVQINESDSEFFSDAAMGAIGRCTLLEDLDLSHTKISDAGVAQLTNLKRLRRLALSDTCITDAAIEPILRLPSLERLEIVAEELTDKGVRRVLELPQLKFLAIHGAPRISVPMQELLQARIENVLVRAVDYPYQTK